MVSAIVIFLCVVGSLFLLKSKRVQQHNPVLAKCPACEKKMTKHAWSSLWLVGDWALWFCFLVTTGLWNAKIPGLVGFPIFLVLAVCWTIARDRLYHAYWTWRHPLRCEEGGHVAPQPEGGSA